MTTLLAQAVETGGTTNTAEVVLFSVFSVIALGAGLAVITMRNMVHAALMLVINMLAIAGLYLTLQSGFLSIIQIIVYAGAIMVLFLFVIMLLGVDRDDLLVETRRWHRVGAGVGTLAVAGVLLYGFAGTYTGPESRCGDQAPIAAPDSGAIPCVGMDAALASTEEGSVGVVAERLFGRYTFPFEVSALLLTVATIGAMLLGRRTDLEEDEDPAYVPSAAVPGLEDVPQRPELGPEDEDGAVPLDATDIDNPSDVEAPLDATRREVMEGRDPHPVAADRDDLDPNPDPDASDVATDDDALAAAPDEQEDR